MFLDISKVNFENIFALDAIEHSLSENLSERFQQIKNAWEIVYPIYEQYYNDKEDTMFDPYFLDWIRWFSPIERLVWNDIRCSGVPLLPQFPTHGYFIDFAHPFRKIAVECDGAAFHDEQKDFIRDARLIKDGWLVFRITGRECNKTLDIPCLADCDYDQRKQDIQYEEFFFNTSEGVIRAIKEVLFPRKNTDEYKHFEMCVETLNRHKSKAHDFIDFHQLNYDLKFREAI